MTDWHRIVRGWIVQQAIKMNAPEITDADVFLFLDTDVFFIRPFNQDTVVRNGRVRFLRRPGMAETEPHMSWHRTAAKLLEIPARDYFGADFVGNAIIWRRDVCLEMRERVASVASAHWFSTVARQFRFSEYMLYGIFVQELLGLGDLRHAPTSEELSLDSWDRANAQSVAARLEDHHVLVNIQSNLGLSITELRRLLDGVIALAGSSS